MGVKKETAAEGLERLRREKAALEQDIDRVRAILGIAEDDLALGMYPPGVGSVVVPAETFRMILKRLEAQGGGI